VHRFTDAAAPAALALAVQCPRLREP